MRPGRAVSAERTPVRPPAPTVLRSMGDFEDTYAPRCWVADPRPFWQRLWDRVCRRLAR